MKLVIKSAAVWGQANIRKWEPENPQCVAEEVIVDIGPKAGKQADSFRLRVATPERLAALDDRDGILATSPLLVMRRYDGDALWPWLERTVASCEADTWRDCVDKLKVYFGREYQGMT